MGCFCGPMATDGALPTSFSWSATCTVSLALAWATGNVGGVPAGAQLVATTAESAAEDRTTVQRAR